MPPSAGDKHQREEAICPQQEQEPEMPAALMTGACEEGGGVR